MATLHTPCILPALSADKSGYHRASLNGKTVLKHRLEYCKHNNVTLVEIRGKIVMHICDNKSCINPAHLVLGTQADNIKDMWNKGRENTTIRAVGARVNTAKLTEADVRRILAIKHPTAIDIARQYGVSHTTIGALLHGQTWKHIHKEITNHTDLLT